MGHVLYVGDMQDGDPVSGLEVGGIIITRCSNNEGPLANHDQVRMFDVVRLA